MAGGGNDFLLQLPLAADGALDTVGQAGLRAGGSIAGDRSVCVALGIDGLLRHGDRIADRALLALGEAGFGAGGSLAGNDFLSVVTVKNVQLIDGVDIPNGNVYGNGTGRCRQIAILSKLGVHFICANRRKNAVFAKPGHADAVYCTAICACLTKRSGADLISFLHRNSDGADVTGRMHAPAVGCVIVGVVLQKRP